MKLGSLKEGGRDGILVVVSKHIARTTRADCIVPTLQSALENWKDAEPRLRAWYSALEVGEAPDSFAVHLGSLASPLPRAFQWLDGSAYVNHVELVRKARGAELPESFWTDPLMYQGVSEGFLGPVDPILAESESWGIDFEGEIAVIVDDVPLGVSPKTATQHIKLVMICNDISLRNLIPNEVAKGFGFVHGKPPSAFSPVAVTPDTLGVAWDEGRLHLTMLSHFNGERVGWTYAGVDMTFNFPTLIAHAAKTRPLRGGGTIIGSGTVSNADQEHGYSCIAEIRMIETICDGEPKTPFMTFGDRVRLEILGPDGVSVFGAIDQEVVQN